MTLMNQGVFNGKRSILFNQANSVLLCNGNYVLNSILQLSTRGPTHSFPIPFIFFIIKICQPKGNDIMFDEHFTSRAREFNTEIFDI